MSKLAIFVVAAVAGSLGAVMATYFLEEAHGTPASAEVSVTSTGAGPPVMGDNDCDGDVDANDGLSAFRSAAGLEQLPQSEPCLDIGSVIGDALDTEQFGLHFVRDQIGHVAYCGAVHANNHTYSLDVTAANAPELTDPEDPDSPPKPGHDGAGWFFVNQQDGLTTNINIPNNSSFAFDMHPEGIAGVDEVLQFLSPPKGDQSGGGASITGYISAHVAPGAVDPFTGDGADDNYCVTIGVAGHFPAEFVEGEISTTLPVPDDWVLDGDGSDGGVLAGVPH